MFGGATTTLPPTTITTAPVNSPSMSMAEFNQIASGMTYETVVAIVGGPGELISEASLAGIVTRMYMWDGAGSLGANANAMFQNNSMVSKSQFGLQ